MTWAAMGKPEPDRSDEISEILPRGLVNGRLENLQKFIRSVRSRLPLPNSNCNADDQPAESDCNLEVRTSTCQKPEHTTRYQEKHCSKGSHTTSDLKLVLLITKNLCHHRLWCHVLRNFYPLGFQLILPSWLHQVIDCLKSRFLLQIHD